MAALRSTLDAPRPALSISAAVLGLALVIRASHAAPPDAPPSVGAPPHTTAAAPSAPTAPDLDMDGFLDRLMAAESGGRDDARNPRSSALGPYQFIESTWLDLVRRLFAAECQGKTLAQILALRTDRAFARKAARAYTFENASALKARGYDATFPRLRLAFLLGPQGALRVLAAPPQMRVAALLGPKVANANPFMYGLTVEGLLARAAHDLAVAPATRAGITATEASPGSAASKAAPRIPVRCNLALISCRRWQALAIARAGAAGPPRKKTTAKGR